MSELLRIEDFSFSYRHRNTTISILKKLDILIFPGEVVGLVGESGSGKSTLAKAILRIPDFKYEVSYKGSIYLNGNDLMQLNDTQLDRIRGNEISIIFQDPLSYLNPMFTIHRQIKEVLKHHEIANGIVADEMIRRCLLNVSFNYPDRIMRSYPFELSGGMRQRIMICMAMITRPKLLIADEVTSSLDALIEKEILDNINRLCSDYGTSVLLISHNLPTILKYANRIAIIYFGHIVEIVHVNNAQKGARHPYTKALFSCALAKVKDGVFPFIEGSIPKPHDVIVGCPFHLRNCPRAIDACRTTLPEMESYDEGSFRCHNPYPVEG
ncbi:MAG: ABC transporter ATP-binding protein [Candidatus Hatepunaea meridiana]|nr:ABC transporter ATP-binding protein [Candidatus Hatepunaea meridiana]